MNYRIKMNEETIFTGAWEECVKFLITRAACELYVEKISFNEFREVMTKIITRTHEGEVLGTTIETCD